MLADRTTMTHKLYYHFTKEHLRDGSPIPAIGEWLIHDGPVVICESGLHASEAPYGALQHAPGQMLHQVELEDIVTEHGDEVVAKRRKIIATIDATELLRAFARQQALSVIHLWDCPAITKQYLETGDTTIRSAAESAVLNAARSAVLNTGWAVWNAVEGAARSAAWNAAWSEVWYAARSAAWSAWNAVERGGKRGEERGERNI